MKKWTRTETLALAQQRCAKCFGLGMWPGHAEITVCGCVFRAVFRACHREMHKRSAKSKGAISRPRLEPDGTRRPRAIFSLRNQDYVADFCLNAARLLGPDSEEHRIFRLHYLLGADWKLCCRAVNRARGGLTKYLPPMERGDFFHCVYRIEEKLGRGFAEIEPYALWPLDEYFGSQRRRLDWESGRHAHSGRPVLPVRQDHRYAERARTRTGSRNQAV